MNLSLNESKSTLNQLFIIFLSSCQAKGLKEHTIKTYECHFRCLSRHIDPDMSINSICFKDLEEMLISLRSSGVSANTIRSYLRTFRTFANWASNRGYFTVKIPVYRGEDTIKDPYTNDELLILLKKPNTRHCDFSEYRTWVIINFLLDTGCRASTLRNIHIQDVNFKEKTVVYKHTKNRKQQLMPISATLIEVLLEYMGIRQGEPTDYLFCSDTGNQLTESALRRSVWSYNRRRGVQKTSIHLFRHTFAKKYLLDCKGNAFALQKILGHSTLDMTRRYCAIYNAELFDNYDKQSPLAQINKKTRSRIKIKTPK